MKKYFLAKYLTGFFVIVLLSFGLYVGVNNVLAAPNTGVDNSSNSIRKLQSDVKSLKSKVASLQKDLKALRSELISLGIDIDHPFPEKASPQSTSQYHN